ncbi:MAG: baseplate J/gp47 family protein [Thermomicrobiales bacterium]
MVQHATERVIAVTPRSTLDGVLDQLRDLPPGSVILALDPLAVLFSTPDHFRALDGVRVARALNVTIAADDPHRTGLALAFGYRVRPRSVSTHRPDLIRPRETVESLNGTHRLAEGMIDDTERPDVRSQKPDADPFLPTGIWHPASGFWKAGIIIAVCVAAIIGGGALLMWRVHTAEVVITPAEQSFSRVVPFAVSVLPTDDPNAIQTAVFASTIARDGDAPATGKMTVPDGTATGGMTFRSRADGATTIKAGTTFKGSRDVSYTLVADVVVPALDFVRGQLGEASGKVRATQPGPVGNLSAGFSARYTDNVTYICGEMSGGTEKQVPVVTEDDIAAVRARLESDARMHALTEVTAALPGGTTALNDYLAIGTPTTTAQPVAGTQADSTHVRVALGAQVPVYRNADFDALIDRRLGDAAREAGGGGAGGQEMLPATVVKSKPVFVSVEGPLVRYFATVTGKTRSVIADATLRQLRDDLTGHDAQSTSHILAATPSIAGSRITYGPSWLPKPLRERMPRQSSHIILRVETS